MTSRLSERLGWTACFEPVSENPYLDDFYQDMDRWAFHSQLYFLTDRLNLYRELQQKDGVAVQDRSMYEDAEVFARNLYMQGHMNDRDYSAYTRVFRLMSSYIQPPELVVYLKASPVILKQRILQRGRTCEKQISNTYLKGLNRLYDEWIDHYSESSVLTINTGSIDIVRRPNDLERVVELIREAVNGKQEELIEDL